MDDEDTLNSELPVEARTREEEVFLRALLDQCGELDVWPHVTPDGRPWLIVSLDFCEGSTIVETLRLDFEGSAIHGGWSPACLNWDDGVSAADAGIDTSPPDGIALRHDDPSELARAAARWFEHHRTVGRTPRG